MAVATRQGMLNADRRTQAQITGLTRRIPAAGVIRIGDTSHAVFRSNEADVLRELHVCNDAVPAGR